MSAKRKIRAIMYGLGAMGRIATKLLAEKGVEIVGAVGHTSNLGKDIGELAGLDYPLGVPLSADADIVLSKGADIVLLCATGGMASMFPMIEKCVVNQLNVVTIGGEALYPWRCAPQLARRLDDLAKQYGVTVAGTGIEDVFWINLVSVLAAASHSIEVIQGEGVFNCDDYGPEVLNEGRIGTNPDEFDQIVEDPDAKNTSPFGPPLEALAANLQLTIREASHSRRPIISENDLECKGLGRVIKGGQVAGISEIDEISTHQGITLRGILTAKIFEPGDAEKNTWVIQGTPELHLENRNMPGKISTCAIMVNRIPDIVACEPGLVSIEKLPAPRYRTFNND